jgi:small multidrug resistance pump
LAYVYLAIAIIAEVIGTYFLKLSDGFTRPVPATITVAGYGLAFYFLALTLKTVPTGLAYAIWSGVGIVLITAASWIFQGQNLDAAALAGIALIIAGVAVIYLLSPSAGH